MIISMYGAVVSLAAITVSIFISMSKSSEVEIMPQPLNSTCYSGVGEFLRKVEIRNERKGIVADEEVCYNCGGTVKQ